MESGILNERLHFGVLSQEEQKSFHPSPPPFFMKFERGMRLYKWTEFGLVNPKDGRISQYWLPWSAFKAGGYSVPGFKELRMRYRNVGGAVGTPQEFARARNAVTEQWNGMNSILYAELKEPVWGFVGKSGSQRAYYDSDNPKVNDNVFLIGGDYQLCIPNLTPSHIQAFRG